MKLLKSICILVMAVCVSTAVTAYAAEAKKEEPPLPQILFKNVNIFDGKNEKLAMGRDVLVVGNLIERIDQGIKAGKNVKVIEGKGRTLMPGLIDSHVHLHVAMVNGGVTGLEQMGWQEIGARVQDRLLEGFTTVRDMGATDTGLKKAIDDGTLVGPRKYPSAAYISQTSGHFDLRQPTMRNPSLTPYNDSNIHRLGMSIIADGPDAVTAAVRQNLSQGATQIKLANRGGVVSTMDPLHTRQYSMAELKAAVDAAADWDTYVATHSISDDSVSRAVDAGVKSIEHAAFLTEETARKVKTAGVYIGANVTAYSDYALQIPHMKIE